jgi:exopolysaccharide biosynthesis polyprenyl glycosylphosphotransferase
MVSKFGHFLAGFGFRLIMLIDLLLLTVVLYGTMFVRFGTEWPGTYAVFIGSLSMATLVFIATFYLGGFYEPDSQLGALPLLPRALRLSLVAGGIVALITLSSSGFFREFGVDAAQGLPFPFVNLLVLMALGPMSIAVSHRVAGILRDRRQGKPRILLAGSLADASLAREHFDDETESFELVGVATTRAALRKGLEDSRVTDVVMVTPDWLDNDFEQLTYELERGNIHVLLRVSGREVMYGLGQLRTLSGLPFVQLRATALPRSRSQFKRLIDLFFVLVLAPLWVPVFALTMAYQLVVAGWPLFYVQNRVGLEDKVFPMLKFRTMRVGAEAESGPVLSQEDDPRVIKASRWIRATRLDELPQLINVLSGDMSLVGPRPERPEMTAGFTEKIPGYRRRHSIRPGLTGLAQIYGRYKTSAEYKLGYDLHYASNWSPVLDLEILIRTIFVVLARRV